MADAPVRSSVLGPAQPRDGCGAVRSVIESFSRQHEILETNFQSAKYR